MDWKRLFDSIGMNGTWWQWRMVRLEAWFRDTFTGGPAPGTGAAYRYTFCRKCGSMMLISDPNCGRCGASAPSRVASWFQRTLGLILPRWHPSATLLLFANVANLLAVMFFFGPKNLLQPDSLMLVKMGALEPTLFAAGDVWRLITYAYLHIGLLHVAFNLIALSQVGPVLEEQVGGARLFVLYTVTAITGGVFEVMANAGRMMIIAGASGALFGFIGFGLSFGHFMGGMGGRMQRNFFLHWAIYGFAFGMLVGAANLCHLGGLVGGLAMGWLVSLERRDPDRFMPVWKAAAWLCFLATIASFAMLVIHPLR